MNLHEFYKNKKVLITGHTGFKGSWLCSILLEFDAEICGVSLEPQLNPNLFSQLNLKERIKSHYIVDIRNLNKLIEIFDKFQPEIVFHLAAQPLVIDSYEQPVYTYDVNVMGTVNICECVRLSKSVKSFVNITTDKVYENIENEDYAYIESDRLNGYDPYSNSKSCSELITDSYKKSFFNKLHVAVSTCRAGNVIGGGDYSKNRIIPDCVRFAKQNEKIQIRNPHSIRPYQHVLEADMFYLVLGMLQYEDIELEGNYNVCPNQNGIKTTGEICDIFCDKWGEDLVGWCNINKSDYHEANYLKLSNKKVLDKFGWKPILDIERAISFVVEFEKSNNKILCIRQQIIDFIKEIPNYEK